MINEIEKNGEEPTKGVPPTDCAPPRGYKLGRRQANADLNRTRILAAARDLILSEAAMTGFSMDAVAKQAGVTRMTVYHQFGSKLGLLEALFDEIGARGGMGELRQAFTEPKPREALRRYIATFCAFWDSDRVVMRRLRGIGALDAEFEAAIRERDGWRRQGAQTLVSRLNEKYGVPSKEGSEEAVEILCALTSFGTYDSLAGATRGPDEVSALLHRLVLTAFGLGMDG